MVHANEALTIENDTDGIVSVGQAAHSIVQKAGQAMVERQADAQHRSVTPYAMLDRVLANGGSLEMVGKMMGLIERQEANEARKAFNEAFAAFKSEAVVIVRNKEITDGPLKGKSYAELFSFVDAVTPALSKHGLSHSWDITRDEEKWIEVTCIIEHALGFSKKVKLGGPPDAGGAKNQLQARISTITYLERATLKAACGLAEQGDDTNGNGKVAGGAISEEQAETLRKLIEETGTDIQKFCEFAKIESVPELPAAQYQRAVTALEAKRRNVA